MGKVIELNKTNVVLLDKKRSEKNKESLAKFRNHINNKIQQIADKVATRPPKPHLSAVNNDAHVPTVDDHIKKITETIDRIDSITKKLQQAGEAHDDDKK